MANTADLIFSKLAARYPTEEKTLGGLLRRYRADQALVTYEQYVDHVSPSSASQNIGPAATTPDHVDFAIGDLDVRVLCETNWNPAVTHWMAGQGDHFFGTNLSWAFSVHGNGKFRTAVSADGTVFSGPESTVPLAHSGLLWIRSTVDVNNGAGGKDFAYYTSRDGTSWTQLGTTITEPGAITLFNSAAVLGVPGVFGGPQRTLYMELRNGINGAIVANPDFRGLAPGTTSFADTAPTPKTWTVGAGGQGAVGNYGALGDAENAFWDAFVP